MFMDAASENTGPDGKNSEAHRDGAAGTGREDTDPRATHGLDLPDPRKLAQDWITLWQSEISAIAADPELRESWQTVMALWAGAMSTVLRGIPREQQVWRHDGTPGRSGPAETSRASAAASAPDARDAEIERLADHVAALERRLAELERGGDPPVHPKRSPGPRQGRKPRR